MKHVAPVRYSLQRRDAISLRLRASVMLLTQVQLAYESTRPFEDGALKYIGLRFTLQQCV
jgi:hypothetical protein